MSKARYLRLLKCYKDLGEITPETYKNAKKWLTNPEYAEYREDVERMIRPVELSDSFYQMIPFGTGGRRGTVGVGTNRINERTIAESAQGLANHILAVDKDGKLKKRGVAIGYDVRPTSESYAKLVADILVTSGVRVFLFEGPRPTPVLSFAIRHLGCIAGAILTASHNPPSDNGFKAYWEDGGQVVPPNDRLILKQVKKVKKINLPAAGAKRSKLIKIIGKKVDEAYFAAIAKLALVNKRSASIVYSPLHGTGVVTVPRVLSDMGFKKVFMPKEQVEMNGYFPTVKDNYPNPEMPAAMSVAVELGKKKKADLVMASDPDGDRLGVFAPDRKGQFVYLTGNQVGAMLFHFICESLTRNKAMPANPFALTTLVSTRMARAIAESYNVKITDDLLVGFKWMARVLHEKESAGEDLSDFIFSFEESIGFMRGGFVRDKDCVSGAMTIAELTAWCKSRRMSLLDYLDKLYEKYGTFREYQFSKFLRGKEGSVMMDHLMQSLRSNPPQKIGTYKVHTVIDRQAGTHLETATGKVTPVKGTKGNVIVFELDKFGYTSVTVRPSGTEPKVKHYFSAFGKPGKNPAATKKRVDGLINKLAAATEKLEEEILAKF